MSTSGRAQRTIFPADRPLLYYVTDRHQLSLPSTSALLRRIRRAIAWGVDFIQLREKDLSDHDLFDLTRGAVALARGTGCRILVNGRFDIAFAAGARGVHLPASGLRIDDVRRCLAPGGIVGASAHSVRQARDAWTNGADYVLLGPVFQTPSKAGYGPPLGLARLARACATLDLPILALGGIGPAEIPRILEAGAAGVAGIRLFQRDLRQFSRDDVAARFDAC